jgi:hypothetical protein
MRRPFHGAPMRWERSRKLVLGASGILCLLLVCQLVAVLLERWNSPTTFDDAYFFCRYADHLLAGDGLAWNAGGPQTYGVTSLLYTFWIAALKWITGDASCSKLLAVAAWIPIVLALVVTAIACARLARRPTLARPIVAAGFVALCAAVQPGLFYQVQTGMDTTTAVLTNALLVLCVVDPRFTTSVPRAVAAGFVSYLTFLARPDNLVYAALIPPLALALDSRGSGRRWRLLGSFTVTFVVLMSLDTWVKTLVFGDPLPLSFYAKTGTFYEGYTAARQWNPFLYTRYFLLNQAIPLLVLLLGVGRDSWRLVATLLVPCIVTFAYLATTTQIMGYEARLYYPALPLWVAGAYHVLDRRIETWTETGFTVRVRPLLVRVATVLAAALVLFPLGSQAASWYYARATRLNRDQLQPGLYRPESTAPFLPRSRVLEAIARMVGECPRGVVWAMSEHGSISASAPDVRIVDLTGLHDRSTLAGKSIVQELFDQAPDVIWFPHRNYTGMVNALLTHPSFDQRYDFWPAAFNMGLAVRRDSPQRDKIQACLATAWSAAYSSPLPPPAVRVW